MFAKQKVNDKCACGSGKKYKICCMHKVLHKHIYLPPKTMEQFAVRATLEVLMAGISVPHCKVCGDTEKESKIVKIPTQIGDIYLCEDCYRIQKNML